ncbi:IS4/Tn5 family transposase DNA-binding protein [Burkholderia sp. DN3021]
MEFKGIDLGDKRLNRRAILLAEQLGTSKNRSDAGMMPLRPKA